MTKMAKEIVSRLRYPNPFTPVGIEFELPEPGSVTVKILDETGVEVQTLVENKQFKSGKHLIPTELSKFAGGSYVYQLFVEVNGEKIIETKKIV